SDAAASAPERLPPVCAGAPRLRSALRRSRLDSRSYPRTVRRGLFVLRDALPASLARTGESRSARAGVSVRPVLEDADELGEEAVRAGELDAVRQEAERHVARVRDARRLILLTNRDLAPHAPDADARDVLLADRRRRRDEAAAGAVMVHEQIDEPRIRRGVPRGESERLVDR